MAGTDGNHRMPVGLVDDDLLFTRLDQLLDFAETANQDRDLPLVSTNIAAGRGSSAPVVLDDLRGPPRPGPSVDVASSHNNLHVHHPVLPLV
jgi:hypothetical protein